MNVSSGRMSSKTKKGHSGCPLTGSRNPFEPLDANSSGGTALPTRCCATRALEEIFQEVQHSQGL